MDFLAEVGAGIVLLGVVVGAIWLASKFGLEAETETDDD